MTPYGANVLHGWQAVHLDAVIIAAHKQARITIGVLAHMQRIVHRCANGALVNKVPCAKLLDLKLTMYPSSCQVAMLAGHGVSGEP